MSVKLTSNLKFIVDSNVGKSAKWLRMIGCDVRFFDGSNDAHMLRRALDEGRVMLTRDIRIVKGRVVTSGQLRTILITSDDHRLQTRQAIDILTWTAGDRSLSVWNATSRWWRGDGSR